MLRQLVIWRENKYLTMAVEWQRMDAAAAKGEVGERRSGSGSGHDEPNE